VSAAPTAARQLSTGSARRVTLSGSTGPIAALQAGVSGRPAVLLVPGYTGSKEDFGPILDPIADAGFHVTAIDLPGQFESPGPLDLAGYTPDALGVVVREIAAALGPDVHLVGHSFGGLVARAAVIADRAAFADLVLMDSGPAALGGARRARIELLAPVLAAAGLSGVYAAIQAAESADAGYVAPPAALGQFLERRFVTSSAVMLQGMADALRAEPDRVAELAGTGISCLVLHGAADDAWPPEVQAEMAVRLGAAHTVLDAAGHSPAVEDPPATAEAVLDFWVPRPEHSPVAF
jgi:pimeloyl-ACP methyl ester carboxylesterase